MTPLLVSLCVLAAVLELDTTYAFQFTFSRGIIAGPIFSLLTGDLMAGIQVGVFTELLFCDINPLGAILPPSAVICCALSMALYAVGIELYFAFIVGVLMALVFAQAEKYMRKRRVGLLTHWENKIFQKPQLINRVIFFELGSIFLINFILISLMVGVCIRLMLWLVPHLPSQTILACQIAYMAVPWIGLASLIPELRFKKRQ